MSATTHSMAKISGKFALSLLPPSLMKISSTVTSTPREPKSWGRDLGAQELVSHIRPVAPQRLRSALLARRLFEGVHHGRRQRPRDVADAERDDARVGMDLAKRLRAPLDLGEEVARLQVQVVLVDPRHRRVLADALDRAPAVQ